VGATQIAANLAFINWVVLTGLAFGSMGAVVLLRERTAATRGYLSFTAFTAAAFGILALLSDLNLPTGIEGLPVSPDPAFDTPRRVALGIFVVLAVAYTIAMARSRRATPLGLLGIAAAVAVDLVAALGWGGRGLGSVFLLTQLLALDLAIGGVWAAMILGHWYLVTPKLPEQPLILLSRFLLVVVAVQIALWVVWLGVGATIAGLGGSPFAELTGQWAFFVWMRLIIGLAFPLVLSWAAIQTAKTRSMESATGLLYINVGTIAAGTILAAGLLFGAGLLV
jgi:hypothetical protein